MLSLKPPSLEKQLWKQDSNTSSTLVTNDKETSPRLVSNKKSTQKIGIDEENTIFLCSDGKTKNMPICPKGG